MSKVLIIEDDPTIQKMYRDEFEKEGFETVVASEGKKGIIEAAKTKPQFILLDLMMPGGMDGVTALRHLKELPQTANIPVAILTVVAEGVPQRLSDPKLSEKVVGYWRKDEMDASEIVNKVQEYLLKS